MYCSYSLYLNPCDFYAIPKIKKALKNVHWESVEEIERVIMESLNVIPDAEFQECFQQWESRWVKCKSMEDKYFDGTASQMTICDLLW